MSPTVYVEAGGRYVASVSPNAIEAGGWCDAARLLITGELARGVADGLDRGRQQPCSIARLRGLAAGAPSDVRALLEALAELPFARATPADVVRMDGFEMLWIELLGTCNLRCVHCYASAGPDRRERLAPQTVLRVLDDAAGLGFRRVQLTGGEPLLYAGLRDLAAHARELGLEVEVFTNGRLLDETSLNELRAFGADFAFSLYAHRADVHDAITQVAGSWSATVRAIERVREGGLRLRVAVVIMEANRDIARDTVAFARALVGPRGHARGGAARQVGRGCFDERDLRVALEITCDSSAERSALAEPSAARHDFPRLGKACVASDGRVFPCIFSRWIELGRIGRDGGLLEILRAPKPRRAWKSQAVADRDRFMRQLACPECQSAALLLGSVRK